MANLNLKITDNNKHLQKMDNQKFSTNDKGKLAKAAKDFETMMTSMMLKSMSETTEGFFGKDSFGGDTMDTLFQQEVAAHMTKSKGLGIAKILYKNITGEDLTSELLDLRIKKPKDYVSSVKNNIGEGNTNFAVSAKAIERLKKYDDIIESAAQKYNVDSKIIRSIILTESAANHKAVSRANAKGLMQLMDGTARQMGVSDSFDPVENIHGGTKYFASMLKKYDGDITKALAAYNAGPGNVEKYDGVPPFRETKNYIARVKNYLSKLD